MGRPGFHCITFGCQMNVNDSQWVTRALMRLGFEEKSLEEADVVFLNTCSVREKPEQKVYSALGRVQRANPRAGQRQRDLLGGEIRLLAQRLPVRMRAVEPAGKMAKPGVGGPLLAEFKFHDRFGPALNTVGLVRDDQIEKLFPAGCNRLHDAALPVSKNLLSARFQADLIQ